MSFARGGDILNFKIEVLPIRQREQRSCATAMIVLSVRAANAPATTLINNYFISAINRASVHE